METRRNTADSRVRALPPASPYRNCLPRRIACRRGRGHAEGGEVLLLQQQEVRTYRHYSSCFGQQGREGHGARVRQIESSNWFGAKACCRS
eukprot:4458789-Pleurochrysis_carterae.AAC.1